MNNCAEAVVTRPKQTLVETQLEGIFPDSSMEQKLFPVDSVGLKKDSLHVVVIGSGRSALQFVNEFSSQNTNATITMYGRKPPLAYKRGLLYSFLKGETSIKDVMEYEVPSTAGVVQRYGINILNINSANNTLLDSAGNIVRYDKLILASSSTSGSSYIASKSCAGIYSMDTPADALRIHSRKARTNHTVVVGGDAVAVEVAKGMLGPKTEVTIIDQDNKLMREIRNKNSEQELLEQSGLMVYPGKSVVEILGDKTVEGVLLQSGEILLCDTVIIAADKNPSIDLALSARLQVGRGVVVNGFMQTSNPDIYAIGDCAEFGSDSGDLAGSGLFEQALLVVSHLAN